MSQRGAGNITRKQNLDGSPAIGGDFVFLSNHLHSVYSVPLTHLNFITTLEQDGIPIYRRNLRNRDLPKFAQLTSGRAGILSQGSWPRHFLPQAAVPQITKEGSSETGTWLHPLSFVVVVSQSPRRGDLSPRAVCLMPLEATRMLLGFSGIVQCKRSSGHAANLYFRRAC